jgi:hypothetical protein
MIDKNVTASNGRKLYLATFEFVCGEYGQIFEKAFYAKDEERLEKEIHKYLNGYYGKGNTSEIDRNVYYYFNGEVAVKQHGWVEITYLEQVVNKLL